jgi:ribosomal protein S18 acetylase RimI-like enzyme
LDPNKVSLVPATENDAAEYFRIEKSVESPFNPVEPDFGGIKKVFENPAATVLMVRYDGATVGFIVYEIKSVTEAYIAKFAIDPEFQSRGIGGSALYVLLELLWHQGVKTVELAIHERNRARYLYKRYGFQVKGLVENYAGGGVTRLVMERSLS